MRARRQGSRAEYTCPMTTSRHAASRISQIALSVVLVCGVAAARFASPAVAVAQTQAQRVVQGKVVDKSDAALKGAVVYLKDGHTLSVKSYIAGDNGAYRFGQLAQNTDYSVWAESDGKKSAVKNISSFDTKTEINIMLVIDTGK
jgi:hypothetical protein